MWFLILYLVGLVTGSPLPLDDGCSESVDETIWVPPPASYYGACQHGISRRAWGIADAECDRFWPNGVIQWCYEFPDEFPKWTVPVYNKDNWEEFVTKMMDEGFRDWNGGPEGSIAVSHRGLGQCNQFTTDDLHDKLQMIFNDEKITDSTVGFETHPSMMIDLSLWGASYDELMIGFRHELGHVFGLSHEHQRPDAWEPNPLFKFDCKKDAEYKGYIEEVKPDGTEVAKIVPKDERLKLGFAEDDDHARYDLHRLCTDFRYAQKADYSSTPNVLPETAETWSIHGAFDHPGQTFGPVDLDSIMMYGTVSFDPGVFTFTDGRSIKRNDMPSVIDLDRVAAMYGTKVRNENGEWVYEHNGVLAQAGRVQVPEGMQDMAKSALQLIENLDTDMPDAGAEASSAQEQIAEAIRKPSKDASARP